MSNAINLTNEYIRNKKELNAEITEQRNINSKKLKNFIIPLNEFQAYIPIKNNQRAFNFNYEIIIDDKFTNMYKHTNSLKN